MSKSHYIQRMPRATMLNPFHRIHAKRQQPGPPLSISELLDPLPLIELAHPLAGTNASIVIAVTDATRPTPDRFLLQFIRSALQEAGILPEQITILCATGLHRPMTLEEAGQRFGDGNLEGVQFRNHSAVESADLVRLGEAEDCPVVVSRRAVESDLLIATGVVEPHQYAGFSGGAKTVAIGLAGEDTIAATHGIRMLDREGTRLGRIEGNPFQSFVRKAGRLARLRYVVNVVMNPDGTIATAACGEPDEVHNRLSGKARELYGHDIDQPVHAALVGVPESKGVNLYQASRAATYIGLADNSPLFPGGPIILQADIAEGAGAGLGEERFFKLLSEADGPEELIESMREHGFPGGAQRAYVVARTLVQHPIIVVGSARPDIVEACHMIAAESVEDGIEIAAEIVQRTFPHATEPLRLLEVENGLLFLAGGKRE